MKSKVFATGWIIRRLNTEGVTDVTGTFLECFDIDRNLYILAEVVVFLWRVFIDIVSSAIGILNGLRYDFGSRIVLGVNRSPHPVDHGSEQIKAGKDFFFLLWFRLRRGRLNYDSRFWWSSSWHGVLLS